MSGTQGPAGERQEVLTSKRLLTSLRAGRDLVAARGEKGGPPSKSRPEEVRGEAGGQSLGFGDSREGTTEMGPLEGEKQGVLGEARRKVPETMYPQEGKEQDQNTLRGTGLRAERKEEASQRLPAACSQASRLLHPTRPPRPWSGIHHRSKASGCLAPCWEGASRSKHIHEDLAGELTVWKDRSEGLRVWVRQWGLRKPSLATHLVGDLGLVT